MYWRLEDRSSMQRQSGQVLAESVVASLLLVILLVAIHQVGRWQYRWTEQWLVTQSAGTAAAHGHPDLNEAVTRQSAAADSWRFWPLAEYEIGEQRWVKLSSTDSYQLHAWRLVGAGQASHDEQVTARLRNAPRLWRQTASSSQAVANTLLPTLKAVEFPWSRRGDATQWLQRWEGSVPGEYLQSTPRAAR
jgi:hypothetical protein